MSIAGVRVVEFGTKSAFVDRLDTVTAPAVNIAGVYPAQITDYRLPDPCLLSQFVSHVLNNYDLIYLAVITTKLRIKIQNKDIRITATMISRCFLPRDALCA